MFIRKCHKQCLINPTGSCAGKSDNMSVSVKLRHLIYSQIMNV